MVVMFGLQGQARDEKIAASFQAWLGRHSEKKSTRLAQTASALVYGTSLVDEMTAARTRMRAASRAID